MKLVGNGLDIQYGLMEQGDGIQQSVQHPRVLLGFRANLAVAIATNASAGPIAEKGTEWITNYAMDLADRLAAKLELAGWTVKAPPLEELRIDVARAPQGMPFGRQS